MSVILYGCTIWTLTKQLEKVRWRILPAFLNKSSKQHLTKLLLQGDLPTISQTIQWQRTRYAGEVRMNTWVMFFYGLLHIDTAMLVNKQSVFTSGLWRCSWSNGYCDRKWTQQHKFKFWMRLIAFYVALIPLGKVRIQLSSLQPEINSRADWVLWIWLGNHSRRRKTPNSNPLIST